MIWILMLCLCAAVRSEGVKEKPKSFKDVVESKTFVDKSIFIKHFFDENSFWYITAPKGFGKTTIMNMMEAYLHLNVNERGHPENKKLSSNYKCFEELPTAIFQNSELFWRHFGNYPVAHFKLQNLKIGNNYDDFLLSFRGILADAYQQHNYLLESEKLTDKEKDDFFRISKKNESTFLSFKGKDLTLLLFTHFEKESMILVDDFDSVLGQILSNPSYTENDSDLVLNFLRGFLVTLSRNNGFMTKILVTGTLRIVPPEDNPKLPEVSDLVTVHFSEHDHLSRTFGFTEEDVKGLAEKLGKQTELATLKQWYGGYIAENSNITLYNMESVSKYFETGKLATYWTDAGSIESSLKQILPDRFRKIIIDSISTDSVDITLDEGPYCFNSGNIKVLRNSLAQKSGSKLNKNEKNLFLKYLMDHGYFTVVERELFRGLFKGKVPNLEVRRKLERFAVNYEKSATEKSATEKSATEKSATEKSVTEKSATEKSATEKSATEKSATVKSASQKSANQTSATQKSVN